MAALRNTLNDSPFSGVAVAVWMENCGRVHDVADVATDVEVVAPDDVRDFVAEHGGRLFVWVSPHPGMLFVPCLLETSLEASSQA